MSASEVFFTDMWKQLLTCQAESFLARYLQREFEEETDKKSGIKRPKRDFSNATLDDLLGLAAKREKKVYLAFEDNLETRYEEWLRKIERHNPGVLPPEAASWFRHSGGSTPGLCLSIFLSHSSYLVSRLSSNAR